MEEIEYNFEEATEVVYNQLSPALQEKFPQETIYEILLIMDDYLESVGISSDEGNTPEEMIEVDEDVMITYVMEQCALQDILLSQEEMEEILQGEFTYLEKLGLIEPGEEEE